MVNVMKGVLVECDPAMKQFLLHLDDTNALGKKFVLQDLDDTHMFISADIVEILQDKIDDLMDRLSFPLAENLMETETSVWQWRPQKRPRDISDQFFEDGDRFCCYSAKQLPQETDTEDCRRLPQFPCSIAGCPETFDTLLGYESHYNSVHRHTCSECRRSYPSNHLLEIHLKETHDPLFSLQSGDKFVCLVQGCEQKFAAPKVRKNHMVKKHKYPANYRFDRAKPGSRAAGRQSKAGGDMGNDQQSQTGVNSASDLQSQAVGDSGTGDQNEACDDMEVTLMEKENIPQEGVARRVFSYKVPQNICFGHGSTRSFLRHRGRRKPKHWHQSNMETDTSVHIENVDMGELKDALE